MGTNPELCNHNEPLYLTLNLQQLLLQASWHTREQRTAVSEKKEKKFFLIARVIVNVDHHW